MSLLATQFTHSNINLPKFVTLGIGWLFVTPEMHRVHHHYRMPYSDSNFGNVFSVWDRIFGTYRKVDNAKLIYGVDTHMNPTETENIIELLKLPFLKYRAHIKYEEIEKLEP